MTPRYPQVKVRLIGRDGNAFAILGRVLHAMRRAKPAVPEAEIARFLNQATKGDYDHLLQTVLEWVQAN